MREDHALLVGVDVGTTNVKAMAYTSTGTTRVGASRPLPSRRPREGWEEYELDVLLDVVIQVVRELTARIDAHQIVGVAVTSMGETAAPLDEANQPVHPALAWHDQRGVAEAEQFASQVGTQQLYTITGLVPRHIFGLYKLLWLRAHAPSEAKRLRRWLNMADYIAFWLSGEQAMDPSLATRTSLLDIRSNQLSADLLAAAGLQASLFPPVVDSGTALGQVRAEASAATGLPTHATVAVGGHDHPCGALALGLTDDAAILDSLGTAESVFTVLDEPVLDTAVAASGYEQGRYVLPGRFYAMGGVYTSGAAIDWAAGLLGLTRAERHGELVRLAAEAPRGAKGVLFLPHLRMSNPPVNDPRSRGAFVGLTDQAGQAEIARAVIEGLAYEFYLTYTGLREYFTPAAAEIVVTGGGASNAVGLAIKQQLTGAAMKLADDQQAAARGAAMLAGIGAGVFTDADDAVTRLRCQTEPVRPDTEDPAFYRAVFEERYRPLYAQLAATNHAAAESS